MKSLSVRQPWASLIAREVKTLELRSRPIRYRGELLICASAALARDDAAKLRLLELDKDSLPLGVALAVVEVVGCRPFRPSDEAAACNPWREGLFAWELRVKRRVRPLPVKGKLSLFEVPDASLELA